MLMCDTLIVINASPPCIIKRTSFINIPETKITIPEEVGTPIIQKADNLVILINGYINYLKQSKQGEKEIGEGIRIKESSVSYESSELALSIDDSQLSILDSRNTDAESDMKGT